MELLQGTWFVLVGVLIIGYAILDGFDLGVGILHLFARDEQERRIHLNAIGPVWDGNEVWLLTAGGALFAAFPPVYATVFSGFYLALMLLLTALIARAVSLEFRGKVESTGWKKSWDIVFGIGSLLPPILLGVAFGNILRGIALDTRGNYIGTFFDLLNPYAVLVGILSLSLFLMHGAVFMMSKTEGVLRDRYSRWAFRSWIAVLVLYAAASAATLFVSPNLFTGLTGNPLFWILFLLLLGSILAIPLLVKRRRSFPAFVASSSLIASMIGLSAISLYPNLGPSLTDPSLSLTISNSSSSQETLTVMLTIALIGMPLVIAYTIVIHRVFRGRVIINEDSY
jgi:cytochrome d ubiquinol oxidase subunit II